MQGKTLIEQRRAEPDDDAAPDGQDAASSDRLLGGKALSIRKVHLQEQSLYGEMLVGRFGDHETALSAPVLVDDTEADDDTEAGAESKIDQGSTDVSLAGRAPARRFRFVLTLPVKGKKPCWWSKTSARVARWIPSSVSCVSTAVRARPHAVGTTQREAFSLVEALRHSCNGQRLLYGDDRAGQVEQS